MAFWNDNIGPEGSHLTSLAILYGEGRKAL